MSLPHTDDDLEEDDELANSDIREAYKQNSNNVRAFMVLRFRHFATFAVIMAFVTTGVLQFDEIVGYEEFAIGFGILMTLLFWNLDHRTSEYMKAHIKIVTIIEKEYFRREKRLKGVDSAAPKARWLSASTTTNLIFFSILIGWCGFMWLVSQGDINGPEVQRPAAIGEEAPALSRPNSLFPCG